MATRGCDVSIICDLDSFRDAADEAAEQEREFDVVLADAEGYTASTLHTLIRTLDPARYGHAVLLMSEHADVPAALAAVRLGASDYLVKPIVEAELDQAFDRAMMQRRLLGENSRLKRTLAQREFIHSVVGTDARMRRVYELVEAVAASRTTVLMTGESGTGKSLIAHAIHRQSTRREKPFVEISCGSIPETLLESELFGHVKGAFTGAHADKTGRFLAADGGTLFLDEINSASAAMQLKLLRVLQERRFEPVGSSTTREVDVRVILASNQPLEGLVERGQFRQDLYYRINVVKIELPPLRDRPDDIPLLAETFLRKHAEELGKQVTGFTSAAISVLHGYGYPGNVRELSNIVERAVVLARRPTIGVEDLPTSLTERVPAAADPGEGTWVAMTLEEALKAPERQILEKALRANGWSRTKTAEQLGINRATLYRKMRALGMLENGERLAG
jgi:DNA-binding NtrC family response regulator